MLVLTRRAQEEIRIGDQIRVAVLSVRGGQVRLGITAPHALRIERHDFTPPPARGPAAALDGSVPSASIDRPASDSPALSETPQTD